MTLDASLRTSEPKQKKSKQNQFESKRDVATLVHTISNGTDVKITYHHYMRFAYLVSHIFSFVSVRC